jgi:hypothetical protein
LQFEWDGLPAGQENIDGVGRRSYVEFGRQVWLFNCTQGDRSMKVLCILVVMTAPAFADPMEFFDDFGSPTLDPAWTVTAGQGSYSLSDRPGYLRYQLTGSTHPNGDAPALKIFRPFDGTDWTFDMKMDYTFGSGNGRQQFTRIFFGDSQASATSQITWFRTKDDAGGGPLTGEDVAGILDGGVDGPSHSALPLLPDTHYLRVIRSGQDLSLLRSADGVVWDAFLSHTFAAPLGIDQILQFSGAQFAGGQQGIADYDFVRLQAVPEPSSLALVVTVLVIAGIAGRVRPNRG